MPFDWKQLTEALGSAATIQQNQEKLELAKKQTAADIAANKALQDKYAAEQQKILKDQYLTVDVPQMQKMTQDLTDSVDNPKMFDLLTRQYAPVMDAIQVKGEQYGFNMPKYDFEIIKAKGEKAKEDFRLINRWQSNPQGMSKADQEKAQNLYVFYHNVNDRPKATQDVANHAKEVEEINNKRLANQDVSNATGGAVKTTEGAAAMNQLDASAQTGTANEGNLVIGAKPQAGTTAKDVGEAVIKQLDTFKSSPDNKPLIEQATAIANAATNLDIAIQQDNPAALGAAFTQVSKASGETRITDEDIKRISPNPGAYQSTKRAYQKYVKNRILPEDAKTLKAMILAQEVANGKNFLKGIDKASNRSQFLPGVDKRQLQDALMKDNNINATRIRFLDAADNDIIKRFNETQDTDERKELQKILRQRQALK